MTFRVVSWNMRFAGPSSKAREYVLALEPNIALLQEVTGMLNVTRQSEVSELHRRALGDGG
jgi:hypothetical protein